MPTPEKVLKIEETQKYFNEAAAVYFTDFKGLSAVQATDLRAQLTAANVEYRVVKKTLTRIAAEKAGLGDITPYLGGMLGLAITYTEPSDPARILKKFSEENDGVPVVTGIVLGTDLLTAEKAAVLANLPSKDALIAQLLGTLNAPMTKLAGTLNASIGKLAQTLSAIKAQKTS